MTEKEQKSNVDAKLASQGLEEDLELLIALLKTVPGAFAKPAEDAARHDRILEKIKAGLGDTTQTVQSDVSTL